MLDEISDEAKDDLPKFRDRNHFVTIGNFLHEPNYDAVLFLRESIWPMIRKQLPKAEIHIYGSYPSQKVNQLHNVKLGFNIKGFAENVNEVMQQAKVCLAPLRFGAGLKGKLVDAMLNGTPCVTTTIGAEGLFEDIDCNGFIENETQNFADKAVELYNNEFVWSEKQLNGFQVINERFNKINFQKEFMALIEETIKQLHDKRLSNFTGQMLQYHAIKSTKYMSKWIEEKNKNASNL